MQREVSANREKLDRVGQAQAARTMAKRVGVVRSRPAARLRPTQERLDRMGGRAPKEPRRLTACGWR